MTWRTMMPANLTPLLWILVIGLAAGPNSASAQAVDEACLACHEASLTESVHDGLGLACTTCHAVSDFPHDPDRSLTCAPCHQDLEERYAESLHGHGLARGNPRAPTCGSCHGQHQLLSRLDPESPTNRNNVPNVCGECHGGDGLLTDQLVRLPQSFQQYSNSVHGKGLATGDPVGASCGDCHSVHDLRGPGDPESKINRLRIAETCGLCHQAARIEYEESIHGRALQAGVTDSPTCIDCHEAHLILASDDPDAPICGARQAQDTCGKCHDDPMIISKYGLQDGVVGSYLESYHGWASRTGCEVTASCVDCHTSHRILPTEDPTSSIAEANVVDTCARCHEGATPAFAAAYDHRSASLTDNPVNRIIRGIYLWVILLVVGGMLLHNLVIMNYFMIRRRKQHAEGHGTVRRFTKSEVVQHLLLTVSFLILLVTGFALRYPGSWWVEFLARIGMTETLRGDIHRVAGVALILTSFYHGWYVLATKRGRQELREMKPTSRDWKEFLQNIRYYTFRSEKKVEFGRYDYSQKAEYWALVWGTALMAITGLVLWFPTLVVRVLPGIVIPASQTIHFYEAVLAGLVILVWHFFFVIFHPEEYPMSWTWLTGSMTKESAEEHHPRWYREVVEGGEEEEAPVGGPEGFDSPAEDPDST